MMLCAHAEQLRGARASWNTSKTAQQRTRHTLAAVDDVLLLSVKLEAFETPRPSPGAAAARVLRLGQNCQFPLRLFQVLEGWDPGGFT